VAKVSVLNPKIFNIYLEAALKGQYLLRQMIRRGKVLVYADDLMVKTESEWEIKNTRRV
jgi:hypothetical protein